MTGPDTKTYSDDYKAGWLDAYGRKPAKQPFHEQPADYREGYVKGERERIRTDRFLKKQRSQQ